MCEDITEDWKRVEECSCPTADLVPAPEDRTMSPDLYVEAASE